MSDNTKIEWTRPPWVTAGATWNPTRGCARVSKGCEHCYAETMAARFGQPGQWGEGLTRNGRWNGRVVPVPEKLGDPLRWRKPRGVFVNSTSDLFHEDVPDEFIAAVFGVMAACPQHTFFVLTKRAERMAAWFRWVSEVLPHWRAPEMGSHERFVCQHNAVRETADRRIAAAITTFKAPWPLPNVWLGVSVEDQRTADERIPHLLNTPAARRFVSYEPALEAVDFGLLQNVASERVLRWHRPVRDALDWLIVGGESGIGARPFNLAWARSAVEQCKAAGVPCFVKQLGARPIFECDDLSDVQFARLSRSEEGYDCEPVTPRLAGRKGANPAEWPKDLRVRQWPQPLNAVEEFSAEVTT